MAKHIGGRKWRTSEINNVNEAYKEHFLIKKQYFINNRKVNIILIDFTRKEYTKFAFITVDVNFRKLSQDELKLFVEVSQRSFKRS